MQSLNQRSAIAFLFVAFLLVSTQIPAFSQWHVSVVEGKTSPKKNRDQGLEMLSGIRDTLKEYYYDKTFKGIDLDEKYKAAKERIKTLEYNWQIHRVLAQFLLDFRDSHTIFLPPRRANKVDYGFQMQMIGEDCIVTSVKKDFDAVKKGLKPGDKIVMIGSLPTTRESLWVVEYLIRVLDPQEAILVTIKDSSGVEKQLKIESKLVTLDEQEEQNDEIWKTLKAKDVNPYKCQSINTQIVACKLETFSAYKDEVDEMMKEVGDHSKLILDLRGNGGGLLETERRALSYFFDREINVGTQIGRKKSKEIKVKPIKGKMFSGELIVLVDSDSGSASEIFARVMQIEKRGIVIGDRTAGAVMVSYRIPMQWDSGTDSSFRVVTYGVSVTVGDMVMSDGGRLENVGVTPDILIGPKPNAFAENTDPVLAYAIQKFGGETTQEEAGKMRFLIPLTLKEMADEKAREKESKKEGKNQ
ncbi:MAG: S41 family peptidase [Pyrinomonadaceae bacterium]